jgi:hypothetical protein
MLKAAPHSLLPVERRVANHSPVGSASLGMDSDNTHGYEFGCYYLPYFISNSDANTNIIEYEYKRIFRIRIRIRILTRFI